jgi:hypothetical protein
MEIPKGVYARRLEEGNPREVAFFEAWKRMHESQDFLGGLLGVPKSANTFGGFTGYDFPLGETTERDRIIASTVIQWLGSNVGIAFLEGVLRELGLKF